MGINQAWHQSSLASKKLLGHQSSLASIESTSMCSASIARHQPRVVPFSHLKEEQLDSYTYLFFFNHGRFFFGEFQTLCNSILSKWDRLSKLEVAEVFLCWWFYEGQFRMITRNINWKCYIDKIEMLGWLFFCNTTFALLPLPIPSLFSFWV